MTQPEHLGQRTNSSSSSKSPTARGGIKVNSSSHRNVREDRYGAVVVTSPRDPKLTVGANVASDVVDVSDVLYELVTAGRLPEDWVEVVIDSDGDMVDPAADCDEVWRRMFGPDYAHVFGTARRCRSVAADQDGPAFWCYQVLRARHDARLNARAASLAALAAGLGELRTGTCADEVEVAAVQARHLIDNDTTWNQVAYDAVTMPMRTVYGPIHPDDPPVAAPVRRTVANETLAG
jgi:hypothetical protein